MNISNTGGRTAVVVERLPFRVEIAAPHNLAAVAALRAASYGKHLPTLGAKLHQPEAADFDPACAVFVAKSKLDDSLLGSFRTHANVSSVLPLQTSLQLPVRFRGSRMVETTRLCIKGNPNASAVRSALFKALHLYCLAQKVDWMMAAGRRPVDRIYDGLLFQDVGEPKMFYPMAHASGVPHRVMSLAPLAVEPLWGACRHPLYHFFFETSHPDIDLSGAKNLDFEWECPDSVPVVSHSACS